jgi:cobalt-zinc-cadmium efflux system outer membrane protein
LLVDNQELYGANLTLEEALAMADDRNPRLRAGLAQIDAARAGITTAKAYPNPAVSGAAGYQTYRVPGNVRGMVMSYTFAQPLELGALRPTRIGLAEREREVSQQTLSSIRLSVLSSVRRAFFQALRAQGEIGILSENLRTVEDFRKRTEVRVNAGEAGRLELYRADAELATARTAVNSAKLRYVTAIAQLRGAIGAPLEGDVHLAGGLDPPAALPTLEDLRKEVMARHPELAVAQTAIRRAEARLSYETAQRRPQPSLVAEFDRPPDSPTYRAGIEIPLPFWNRREGPIAEAAAQVRAADAIAQSRSVELLAAAEGAYGRYEVATQQLEAFEQGLLRAGEEGLRAAEAAYRLGERGILDVLDAQRVLRQVRLDFHNAQFDRQAALIDLDEARAIELRKIP